MIKEPTKLQDGEYCTKSDQCQSGLCNSNNKCGTGINKEFFLILKHNNLCVNFKVKNFDPCKNSEECTVNYCNSFDRCGTGNIFQGFK